MIKKSSVSSGDEPTLNCEQSPFAPTKNELTQTSYARRRQLIKSPYRRLPHRWCPHDKILTTYELETSVEIKMVMSQLNLAIETSNRTATQTLGLANKSM